MNNYYFKYPSYMFPPPLPSEHVQIYESPLDVKQNTEEQDTFYNPIIPEDITEYLHHILKNTPYKDLITLIKDEIKQHMEKGFSLENFYNIDYYEGDKDLFYKRIISLLSLLGASFLSGLDNILYIMSYNEQYQSPSFPSNNLNIIIQWSKNFLNSIPLIKKYRGTVKALKLTGKTIHRNVSIFIVGLYEESSTFSPLTNKYFKMTDFFHKKSLINSFYKLIPNSAISKFPYSVGISGCEDYSFAYSNLINRYDSFKTFDSKIGTPEVIKWDTGERIGAKGKRLLLEIDLDILLKHTNSLGTNECLQDIEYLLYAKEYSKLCVSASRNVIISSQLCLYAKNTGQYISNRSVQQVDGVLYSHPNIKAKFQIFKTNWEENQIITNVQIGSGRWDDGSLDVFVNDLEDPLDPHFTVPTKLQKPLVQSTLGQYEVQQLANNTTVSCLFTKQEFIKQQILNQLLTIAQSEYVGEIPETTIQLPHKLISEGDAKFSIAIEFILSTGEKIKREILIEEIYDEQNKIFKIEPVLLTENGNLASSVLETYKEYGYNLDTQYQQTASAEYIIFHKFPGTNNYVLYDREQGTLKLKLQCNNNSSIKETSPYSGTGIININSQVYCTYSLHYRKRLNNAPNNKKAKIFYISEVGLFNTLGKMVAYGTFPPIIYDPNEFGLSINCVLENPAS